MGAVNSERGGGGFLLFPSADGGWVNNRLSPSGQMGLSGPRETEPRHCCCLKTHGKNTQTRMYRTQSHISLQAANIFLSALKCGEA